MRAGDLNQRIVIEQKQVTRDSMGGEVKTWVQYAAVWAQIQHLSGRELIAAKQAASEVTARITIRYLAGVDASMRVRHGGDVYAISAVVPTGRSRTGMNLECSLGVRDD